MNILGFASENEDEVLKNNPQTLNVMNQIMNGAVQGEGPVMNYQPTQSSVLQGLLNSEQEQLSGEDQQIAQQASEVAQQEQAVQQEAQGETSFLKGLADGFASVFTNPDILTGLNSFSAAMRGDINSYNAYQNAYAERMNQRQQQKAAAVQKERERQAAESREIRSQLWQTYTPESVAEFQRTGDWNVLVENQATQMARAKEQREVEAHALAMQTGNINNQSTTNQMTNDNIKTELEVNKARDERMKERRRQQNINSSSNGGQVTPYRDNGGVYQRSEVDKDGNIVWKTITDDAEIVKAKQSLGIDTSTTIKASADESVNRLTNSNKGKEDIGVTGYFATGVNSLDDGWIKSAAKTTLNAFNTPEGRQVIADADALDAELNAIAAEIHKASGGKAGDTATEQANIRRNAPAIDRSSMKALNESIARGKEFRDKYYKSKGQTTNPSSQKPRSVAPVSFG